jgi:hypothetical protein
MATLTIGKQNLLFECLQGFEVLRNSLPRIAALPFNNAARPVSFAPS